MTKKAALQNDVAAEGELEFARWDYKARSEEVQKRIADISRNYQWVLGATALVVTSKILGGAWSEVDDFWSNNAILLTVGALATLWFPAYDKNMWADLRMLEDYLRFELPRRGVTTPWRDYRHQQLMNTRPVMAPVWAIRNSLPYWTTVIFAFFAVRANMWGTDAKWWLWFLLGAWLVAFLWLILAMLSLSLLYVHRDTGEIPRWQQWLRKAMRLPPYVSDATRTSAQGT